MNQIYIYGASGHGLVVADIAKACEYDEIIFLDDGDNDFLTFEDVKINNKIPLAFGIGSNKTRKSLFEKVKSKGFEIASLIHPSSVISDTVTIDEGTVIMPNVIINANSKIGKGVILNSSSIIEHESIIENFVHISPSATLAGNVTIKSNSHIGIGSCIIQGLEIGENTIIGAGSVVVKNIGNNKLAYGNPCKIIKEISE